MDGSTKAIQLYSILLYSLLLYSLLLYSLLLYSLLYYSTLLYPTLLYSTEYSTLLYSPRPVLICPLSLSLSLSSGTLGDKTKRRLWTRRPQLSTPVFFIRECFK